MTNSQEEKPNFWQSTSPPLQSSNQLRRPDNLGTRTKVQPGPGMSIGAIVLAALSLPSSLLIPPFAAILALAGIALAGVHIKRSTRRPKLAIVAGALCGATLMFAIGMTFYAYLVGPAPGT